MSPDAKIIPLSTQEGDEGLYRYSRDTWISTGVDEFTQPPSQHQDECLQLTNVLPPITSAILRRFGYAVFTPKLDQGIGTGGQGGGNNNGDQTNTALLFGVGFDGRTGYVSTAKELTTSNNPTLSVEFWFETQTTSGGYFVTLNSDVSVTTGETEYFGIFMNPNGTIGVGFYDGSVVSLSANTPLAYNDGQGHQVDVTVAAGVVLIYIDGVLVVTSSVTTTTGTFTGYWRLAQGSGGTGWPGGISYIQTFLSHVSIWSVALTQSQITAHYVALTGTNGSQQNYEAITGLDKPDYFWYLTESVVTIQPSLNPTVQSIKTASSSASFSITFPNPVTLHNSILVIVGQLSAGAPSVSDSFSNTYNEIGSLTDGGYRLTTFIAISNSAGTPVITITASHASQQVVIAEEISGFISSGNPVDTQKIIVGGNGITTLNVTGPTITTADEPDHVYSILFGQQAFTLNTGQGYGLADSFTTPSSQHNYTSFIGVAYENAPTAGTYPGATWVATSAAPSIIQTVGFQLLTQVVVPGTTAIDYADSNNGTYSTGTVAPNNLIATFAGSSGQTIYTITVTPATLPIFIGDTGFISFSVDPYPSGATAIATITDNLNNTWLALTPALTYVNAGSRNQLVQTWYAGMTQGVALTDTLTITLTFNNDCTPSGMEYVNIPALGAQDQSNDGTGTSTHPSSGGVTVDSKELVLAVAGDSATIGSIAVPYTILAGSSGANNVRMAYAIGSGIITDTWTATSGNWTATASSFYLGAQGFSLGESIVVD